MGDKETKTMSKQPLVSAWMQDHGIDMAMLSEVGVKMGLEGKAGKSNSWDMKLAGHDPVREKGACAILGAKRQLQAEVWDAPWSSAAVTSGKGLVIEKMAGLQSSNLGGWQAKKLSVEDRGRIVRVVLTDIGELVRWHFICMYAPSAMGDKERFWKPLLYIMKADGRLWRKARYVCTKILRGMKGDRGARVAWSRLHLPTS